MGKLKFKNVEGGICAPSGFTAAGSAAGIKKSKKKDMAIIYSNSLASVAGVLTTNLVKAAPILVSQKVIKKGYAHAVVINSGNANACTGEQGMADANEMADQTAQALRIKSSEVLVASTGIIGVPMPMKKIVHGIWGLSRMINKKGAADAAEAILTTDLRKKEIAIEVDLGGKKKVTIAGIAKGSGMICPNMATMICVITTDAVIEPALLQKALTAANADSFNMITVDNDMSTNDCAFALASNVGEKITGGAAYNIFAEALKHVCVYLAKEIARDGEGATKLFSIEVKGAKTSEDARKAAKMVAGSSLFKCAVYGADPNVGRLLAAIGGSGADFDPSKVDLNLGEMILVKNGQLLDFDHVKASGLMKKPEMHFVADLKKGKHSATAYGCDMTEGYITINAKYHT